MVLIKKLLERKSHLQCPGNLCKKLSEGQPLSIIKLHSKEEAEEAQVKVEVVVVLVVVVVVVVVAVVVVGGSRKGEKKEG